MRFALFGSRLEVSFGVWHKRSIIGQKARELNKTSRVPKTREVGFIGLPVAIGSCAIVKATLTPAAGKQSDR